MSAVPEPLRQKIYRVLDANLNRAREGLRVVEEVFRFLKKNKALSQKIKNFRYEIIKIAKSLPATLHEVKLSRDVVSDVGRKTFLPTERERKNIKELTMANLQRVQEALRVLEEFSKLIDKKQSDHFKKLRFKAYHLEIQLLRCL